MDEAYGARAPEGLQDDDMDAEDVDERLLEEELELQLGEAGRNWERPPPPPITPATDPIGELVFSGACSTIGQQIPVPGAVRWQLHVPC